MNEQYLCPKCGEQLNHILSDGEYYICADSHYRWSGTEEALIIAGLEKSNLELHQRTKEIKNLLYLMCHALVALDSESECKDLIEECYSLLHELKCEVEGYK